MLRPQPLTILLYTCTLLIGDCRVQVFERFCLIIIKLNIDALNKSKVISTRLLHALGRL